MLLRYVSGMLLLGLLACSQTPVKIVGPPVTVTVALPETARRAPYLLLKVEGILPPKETGAQLRIFAEHAEASRETSAEHAGFIGHVTLLPNPSSTLHAPKSVTLPVPEMLAKRLQAKGKVAITLVPEGRLPAPGIRIDRLRFEGTR